MSIKHLQLAVEQAGGQTALARALSRPARPITQAHVWKWLNSPNPDLMPPAEYCPDIERLTGVRCEDMRPDVNWAVLRGSHTYQRLDHDRRHGDRRKPGQDRETSE